MTTKQYLKGVLPWLLIGPCSGPLAEGVVRNWRAGEVNLARLYALALILTTYDLYVLGGRAVIVLAGFRSSLF
jgi:hypothetical protein